MPVQQTNIFAHKKKRPKMPHPFLLALIFVVISIFAASINGIIEQGKQSEKIVSMSEETVEQEETSASDIKEKEKKKKSKSSLKKSEYKKKCKKMYYDDVFFGEKDLTGKLVKLNVFVKKNCLFEPVSLSDYDFQDEWKIKRNCFETSVKRKKGNSYAGMGIVKLYFSSKKKYKIDTNWITEGKKFTVYGEVVNWSDNTYDGYNDVSIVVRFIEK